MASGSTAMTGVEAISNGDVAAFVASLPSGAEVNVILPGPARVGAWQRLRRGRTGASLARALLPYPEVRTTLVRDQVATTTSS